MSANRLAIITEAVEKVIGETCLTQGWDTRQWEYSITLGVVGQPPNAGAVWTVLLTLDSALVGQPCLMFPARILGARADEADVRAVLTDVMAAMWMARMQQIGVKKAPSNGHGPKLVVRGHG